MTLRDGSNLSLPTTEILSLDKSRPRLSMGHFLRESNGLRTPPLNCGPFFASMTH